MGATVSTPPPPSPRRRTAVDRHTGLHVAYEGKRYPVYRVVRADYFYKAALEGELYFNTSGKAWRHVFIKREKGWKYVT